MTDQHGRRRVLQFGGLAGGLAAAEPLLGLVPDAPAVAAAGPSGKAAGPRRSPVTHVGSRPAPREQERYRE